MKALLFIVGLAFFLGSFVLLKQSLEKLNVDRNGLVVKMEIVSLPKSCIGAKVPYIVKFKYAGVIYDKQTRGDFCEIHYIGQLVELKWLDGIDTVLFPFESGWVEVVSDILLGVLGLVTCVAIWRNRSHS